MDTRRWGSGACILLAAMYLIPGAGQKTSITPLERNIPLQSHSATSLESRSTLSVSSQRDLPVSAQISPPYRRSLRCILTAYTAGYESTGKKPGDPGYGITSSGHYAREGQTIAVDPSLIPIGTRVYIEGIGVRVAEDTGGAVKGAHIDVFFNSPDTAIKFGVKRDVSVYMLES